MKYSKLFVMVLALGLLFSFSAFACAEPFIEESAETGSRWILGAASGASVYGVLKVIMNLV